MLKKITTAVVLVTTCGLTSMAMAQSNGIKSDGFYVDANLGWGKVDVEVDSATKDKNSGFAWNASLGYKFMPYLGAQVGYFGFPKVTHTGSVAEFSSNFLAVLAIKGILPLEDGFSLNVVTGPAWGHTKLSKDANLDSEAYKKGDHSKFTWYFGRGADYNITENFYLGVGVNYSIKSKPVPAMYSVTGNIGYIF